MEVGDKVLVRNVASQGPHKLADCWREEVFHVLRQPDPTIPVFDVQDVASKGPVKTLHRNLLLPVSDLRDDPAPTNSRDSIESGTRIVKENSGQTRRVEEVIGDPSSDGDSGSDILEIPVPPVPRPRRPVLLPRRVSQPQVPVVNIQPEITDVQVLDQSVLIDADSPVVETLVEKSVGSLGDSETSRSVDDSESSSDEGQVDNFSSESPPSPEITPPCRRSQRHRKKPQWLDPDVYVLQHAALRKKVEKQKMGLKQCLKAILDD